MFNTHFIIASSKTLKISTTALISVLSLTLNASALAQQVHYGHVIEQKKSVSPEVKGKALDNTNALKQLMADYSGASAKDKKRYLEEMISLASERQELLSELSQSDPSTVAQVALTAKSRQGMPEEVKALLEQEQTIEGELEVFYEDYEDHRKSRLRHVLKTVDGFVEVHGSSQSKLNLMQSGTKIRARGWKFDNADDRSEALVLANEADGLSVLAQDTSGVVTTSATTSSTALSKAFGEQRTLVLLVNFQDNPQQPWTIDEVKDMVFGKVNDFYKENSFGQTWLTGDVHDYNTLPIDTTTCNDSDIYHYGRLAAEDDGVDLSQYNRLVFLFPEISSCGWSGKGTLGGSQSRAWINGSFTLNTIGHELGHNFGLHHAKQLDCGADVIGDNCISITYGDTMDIMGKDGVEGHLSAHNKELLGWLGSNEIVTVKADGSYILEPYESVPSGTAKSLKIKRGSDSETGATLWYYLEYRQPLGFDKFLEGSEGVTNGIVFRLATGEDILSNELLDMTPSSAFRDMEDSSLAVGSSYTDADAGITFTTEWADSSGASVHVSFAQPVCSTTQPGIMVSPISNNVSAGDTVSYDVTVTNNDSDGCSEAEYVVSANVLSDWSATNSTVSLEPGASSTVTINITSPETSEAGVYDVMFTAMNSAQNEYKSSSISSYIVETLVEECVLANPLLSLSKYQSDDVEPGSAVTYTATVTSQDSRNCEAAKFEVLANLPDGWSGESRSFTLAPAESISVDLSVTSSDEAVAGEYLLDFYTYHSNNLGYNATTEATYTIIEPIQACEPLEPMISISSSWGEVTAGSTINYSVTVTNQNSNNCKENEYLVFAQLPDGWSGSSSHITLSSGESSTVNLSVESEPTAVDGTYALVIHAQDTTDSQNSNSSTVEYVIVNPVNSAPVAVNDSVTMPGKEPVLIDVLSNDSDPEGDEIAIQGMTQGSKGSVEITTDGKLLYTPAKNFKGNDSFNYTVSDGALTATALVTVGINSTTESNPNKGKGNR